MTFKSPTAAWRGAGMPEMETDGGSEMEADTERWRQTQRERDRNITAGVMYRWRREMEKNNIYIAKGSVENSNGRDGKRI